MTVMDGRTRRLALAADAVAVLWRGLTKQMFLRGATTLALAAPDLASASLEGPSATMASTRGVAGPRGVGLRMAGLFCLVGILAAAGVCGEWAAWLRVSGNVHEIEPGVYRSAQLTSARILTFVQAHHIKTVLNLRGANAGQGWYDAEASTVKQAGARLISIRLSADHEPDDATLATVVETLQTADRPILIHCYGGADRAGLASALYELTVAHRPAALAAEQLSFRYGHFPWLTSRTGVMDRAFQRVASALLRPDAPSAVEVSTPSSGPSSDVRRVSQ